MKSFTIMSRRVKLLALMQGLALALETFVPAQSYEIADVGTNSWSYSEAHALSGGGQVVGEYEPNTYFNVLAFLFDRGTLSDLGHLSGSPYAVAYGINNAGQVVGESDTAKSTHAFLYSNGGMTDLGTLGGNDVNGYSSAHAINTAGQAAGESSVSVAQLGVIHAVLYSGGTAMDLGALGGDYSSANGLNNSGIVVGESDVVIQGATNVHAFIYASGTLSDLGTLGGGYSSAKGVNDAGDVVGEAEALVAGTTNLHAFLYHNGTMIDLGTFGGSASSASAINTAGQIVGYATDTNELSNAFLYDGARMINLNDFIPAGSSFTNLSSADAINDAGQIAGSGYLADGSYHAYLLTPVSPFSVSITNPQANASFQAPATFAVSAGVADTAASVTNVQFLVNGSLLGNVPASPYEVTASNLNAGTYTLTAVAFDNAGSTATNTITISVTTGIAAPATLSNPLLSATGFSFSFSTQLGVAYQCQFATAVGSTNPWTIFTNVLGTGAEARVTDTDASPAGRFYRVSAR